jgi:uncharacterized protein YbaR (Trm112 family)
VWLTLNATAAAAPDALVDSLLRAADGDGAGAGAGGGGSTRAPSKRTRTDGSIAAKKTAAAAAEAAAEAAELASLESMLPFLACPLSKQPLTLRRRSGGVTDADAAADDDAASSALVTGGIGADKGAGVVIGNRVRFELFSPSVGVAFDVVDGLPRLAPHQGRFVRDNQNDNDDDDDDGKVIVDAAGPSITLIGSSNLGQRSVGVDTEFSLLVATTAAPLRAQMQHEIDGISEHSCRFNEADGGGESQRQYPWIVRTLAPFVSRWM